MKNRLFEMFFGYLVLLAALIFVIYSAITVMTVNLKNYEVKGIFNNIGSLVEGSNVVINGLIIGKVSKINLESDYSIQIIMKINNDIKIPKDSILTIVTTGIFDSPSLAIVIGQDDIIEPGETFFNTQNWISLEDKIGTIFFNSNK
ncbi:Outer membrane lipid asymmetry maintenance protein [Candidatus Hepatincolaceae symbiont of Richtersius coronifer]